MSYGARKVLILIEIVEISFSLHYYITYIMLEEICLHTNSASQTINPVTIGNYLVFKFFFGKSFYDLVDHKRF